MPTHRLRVRPTSFSHIQQRIATLQRLAQERGARVTISPENEFSEASALEATRALLEAPLMPEGIIFANEILTLGGFQAIAQSGLKTGKTLKSAPAKTPPCSACFLRGYRNFAKPGNDGTCGRTASVGTAPGRRSSDGL